MHPNIGRQRIGSATGGYDRPLCGSAACCAEPLPIRRSPMSTSLIIPPAALTSRRRFVGGLGTATLSATAVALLAGCESMAKAKVPQQAMADPAGDVATLNVALGL